MLEIKIALGGSRPIYRQIMDQVRHAVATMKLAVGDPLPSIRRLAEELVVNQNTVAKAYGELVREGTLESKHGRGVFVARRRAVYSASERKRRLDNALDVFLTEVLALDYTPDQISEAVGRRLAQVPATKG